MDGVFLRRGVARGKPISGAKQPSATVACIPDLEAYWDDREGKSHGREDETDSSEAKTGPIGDRQNQHSGGAEVRNTKPGGGRYSTQSA
jgi:hypothetical protein